MKKFLLKKTPQIGVAKNVFIFLLMTFPAIQLLSQEKAIFTGKIVDAETKQPVELVTLHAPSGITITNTEGEYEIKCNENETISFSHISYHSQQIPVRNIPALIELKPKVFELAEVLVVPRDAIVKELKAVWNKYYKELKGKKEKDYTEKTFFYRQLTFNNDTCVEYIESFFTAPTTVAVTTMTLQEGRFAGIKKNFFLFWKFFLLFPITSVQ